MRRQRVWARFCSLKTLVEVVSVHIVLFFCRMKSGSVLGTLNIKGSALLVRAALLNFYLLSSLCGYGKNYKQAICTSVWQEIKVKLTYFSYSKHTGQFLFTLKVSKNLIVQLLLVLIVYICISNSVYLKKIFVQPGAIEKKKTYMV